MGSIHAQEIFSSGSLSEYVAEVLKNAIYEKAENLDVIVAERQAGITIEDWLSA